MSKIILQADNITLYPTRGNSWNSKGCSAHREGGTHCGTIEVEQCLRSGASKVEGELADPSHAPISYVTMLREPTARVISEYFWFYPCSKLCTPKDLCGAPFSEYISSPANTLRNLQSKMLVHSPLMLDRSLRVDKEHCANGFSAANSISLWNEYYIQKDKLQRPSPGAANAMKFHIDQNIEDRFNSDDEIFESIKQNIRSQFALVAVTEKIAESEQLVSEIFASAIKTPFVAPKSTTTDADGAAHISADAVAGKGKSESFMKKDITSEMYAELKLANSMDMRVYKWVVDTYYTN